jgi:hypothetical protein
MYECNHSETVRHIHYSYPSLLHNQCLHLSISLLQPTSTPILPSYITSVYTSPAFSHNQYLNPPHSLPKHHSLEYTPIKQLKNTGKSHESGASRLSN